MPTSLLYDKYMDSHSILMGLGKGRVSEVGGRRCLSQFSAIIRARKRQRVLSSFHILSIPVTVTVTSTVTITHVANTSMITGSIALSINVAMAIAMSFLTPSRYHSCSCC